MLFNTNTYILTLANKSPSLLKRFFEYNKGFRLSKGDVSLTFDMTIRKNILTLIKKSR
jgi:hypothetical protein